MPFRRSCVTEAHIEQLRQLKREGKSWKECARITGLSENQCSKQRSKLGFKPLHPCKFPKYEGHKPRAKKAKLTDQQRVEAGYAPRALRPGEPTLPPLPSLQMP